jgi:hypothetical protein
MAHLSRWVAAQRVELSALTPEAVERFLESRPASRRALGPLLSHLRDLGVVPEPTALDTPVERLLAEYRNYLVRECGLVLGSVRLRLDVARLFLAGRPEPLEFALQRERRIRARCCVTQLQPVRADPDVATDAVRKRQRDADSQRARDCSCSSVAAAWTTRSPQAETSGSS